MFALGASLVWLAVSGKRQEKLEQKKPRPVEIIQNSKPSATRIYAPSDLQVVSIRMEPVVSANSPSGGGNHSLEVQNVGTTAFTSLLVKISYFGANGKLIESRDYQLNKSIPPAQTVTLRDIAVEPFANKPAKYSGKILFADLESAGAVKP